MLNKNVFLLIFVTAVTACQRNTSDDVSQGCTKQNDCAGNLICDVPLGVCVMPYQDSETNSDSSMDTATASEPDIDSTSDTGVDTTSDTGVDTTSDTGVDVLPVPNPSCPVYVSNQGDDANGGTGWTDTLRTVAAGVTRAEAHVAASSEKTYCQVWIAEGTYTPDSGTDQTRFIPMASNVHLIGGFAGNEVHVLQRNLGENATILSGDIFGDDTGDSETGFENRMENSFWILASDGPVQNVVVDGITFEGEHHSDKAGKTIRGIVNTAAIRLFDSEITIVNSVFSRNSGTCIYAKRSQVVVRDSEFKDNLVPISYSSYYEAYNIPLISLFDSVADFENTAIYDNSYQDVSQGFAWISLYYSTTTVRHCRFENNVNGPEVFFHDIVLEQIEGASYGSHLLIESSFIFDPLRLFELSYSMTASETLVNWIIAHHTFAMNNSVIASSASTSSLLNVSGIGVLANCTIYSPSNNLNVRADTITNSIIVGDENRVSVNASEMSNSYVTGGCFDKNVNFCKAGTQGHSEEQTVVFSDPENGDFSVLPTSSTINAGNNALLPAEFNTDILGNPRVSDGIIDMGAVEYLSAQ